MTTFRFLLCIALPLTLLGCGSRADQPAPGTPDTASPTRPVARWSVTPVAVGTVRFGWSVAQLNAELRDTLRPTYRISDQCDFVHPAAFPAGLRLMVERDTVVRVDVDSAGIPTAEGARVGDTEAETLARYAGRVEVQPHKYTGPQGRYLIVRSPGDRLHLLIFETDGQRVERYRAGLRPAVEYVEGCS
ncbi:MAG: hypothetical protein ABI647_04920 [Gemmatimonadota bacterium]